MTSKLQTRSNIAAGTSSAQDGTKRIFREESLEDLSPEWCQKLLKDPAYEHCYHYTRLVGGPNGSTYNILMGKTLFTDHTFRAMKVLYKPANKDKGTNSELLTLISLGDEMCSHANVLHGGINTTIVDEVAGDLATREHQEPMMAVNFNVNLRKAVRTPGIVLVRAWIERPAEGRKIWVKCTIEQDGVTCIEGESLYLKLNRGNL